MDVGNVRGPGGVDRNADRHQKLEGRDAPQSRGSVADLTSISDAARGFLAAVETLSEEAKQPDPAREEHVREVQQRLQRGELDQVEIYREAAGAILSQF